MLVASGIPVLVIRGPSHSVILGQEHTEKDKMPPLSGEFSLGSASQTSRSNVIMFDQTKNPVFKLTEGLRTLQRKLKGNWKVLSNSGDSSVTTETLSQVKMIIPSSILYPLLF